MPYYEFTIAVAEQFKDRLIKKLTDSGCLGVVERDDSFIAYFPGTSDLSALDRELMQVQELLEKSGEVRKLVYSHRLIPEEDWNETWKKGFVPIDVGDRFTILPPWEEKREGRINLVIDPAMAFGTGHHETTRSCLVLMEKYASPSPTHEPPLTPPSPLEGRGDEESGGATSYSLSPGGKGLGKGGFSRRSFLDVGTGTGILAIAAVKLGFQRVVGVDTDILAVDAGRENIKLNQAESIEIREGSITDLNETFELIAANLISGVLIELAQELAGHLKPGGVAILSGILSGQDDEVLEAMTKAGLKLIERYPDGKWTSLVVER